MKRKVTRVRTKLASKGDRLNWTPLKDVKPLSLKISNSEGRWISEIELKVKARSQNGAFNYLIP